jgi:HTH-type transcriptional regulator/antitoxin HigA
MQIISENLEQYDNEHYPAIGENITEIDMVKYLMKSRNLHQVDLADIFGGQANVSKFLNGERPLSKNQIARLKKRFGISADFFVR